ncbi:MAG: tRNA uridine-5-carboxymethylaminomethyl(34) synthesis GTPase MnmE [Deltaproteobacteria bacterium]|nr:tRNA uridine-5-carboxymethylaminomethyl(34) synthesis GTPase MnmE [Deltaproteobacteria bacterium]
MDIDTIAAIATPPGAGGIGVVKISGPAAITSIRPLLCLSNSSSKLKSHHLYHGFMVDPVTNKTIDEILYTVMKAPHSYTREDVVEIQAHGSRCGLYGILELVLRQGIRLAEPGEFTKRAFLNGRIDLTQAEAVIELISAQTNEGHNLAVRQLKGELHKVIESMRATTETVLVEVEAAIDFPEDVDEILEPETFAKKITLEVVEPLKQLLAHYEEGHIYREGISVIIVGRPNVGKSSLMNQLVQKERSIVTTIPGTTRDFIEETVNIKGIPLRLIDTAGLRSTDDDLEAVGIRLTRQQLDEADVVLFMVDGSEAITMEDRKIFDNIRNRKAALLINKIDLPYCMPTEDITCEFTGLQAVEISALFGRGMERLKELVVSLVTNQTGPAEPPVIVPNLRHKLVLEKAATAAGLTTEGFRTKRSTELIAIDLREILDSLGEVIGITTTEDILDKIFDRFCIGK